MAEPWDILDKAVTRHPGLREWLEQAESARQVLEFDVAARGDAVGVFRYASLFYPRFVEVEGCVVREGAFSESNWAHSCERGEPAEVAATLHHEHIEDLFGGRADTGVMEFLDEVGGLVAFFWQLAIDHQFPGTPARVTYADGVIEISQ